MKYKLQNIFLLTRKIILPILIMVGMIAATMDANGQLNPPVGFKKNRVVNKNPGPLEYPYRTIRSIQINHPDSLLKADTVQFSDPARYWTLQKANFISKGSGNFSTDTMTIVGVVVYPTLLLNYTASGYTIVIADTGYYSDPNYSTGSWRYMLIRANMAGDTSQYSEMLNPERGDVVRVKGYAWEFPSYSESGAPAMHSMTQFVPLKNPNFEIIDQNYPLPEPKKFFSSDPNPFYQGQYPGGKMKFSTGEQWEGHFVEMYDWTVKSWISTDRGTFDMVNDAGDVLGNYDGSKWFTTDARRDPNSTYQAPPIGARIDTIRGWMSCVTGGEALRGYRISPVYPGDVVFGVDRPRLTGHSRSPIVVHPDSAPRVQVTAIKLPNGYPVDSVVLYVSSNYGSFTPYSYKYPSPTIPDSFIASFTLPKRTNNSNVRYFFKAFDPFGNTSLLANPSFSFATDTSKGFFFYTVLNRELTITDLQTTPYLNGVSPYVGATLSVTGVVTTDTSDFYLTPTQGTGTTAWYMQKGNAPYSGIWVVGQESTMAAVKRGDSIRVTGTVSEYFSNTRIQNVQHPIEIIASSKPVPSPVNIPTSSLLFTNADGTPTAEQWEGMLVRFDSVHVTDIDPDFQNYHQYLVGNSEGNVLVRRDGKNNFVLSTDSLKQDMNVLSEGDKIVPLTGIVYFASNKYRIAPRKNSDINAGELYSYSSGWNLISVPFIPADPRKVTLHPSANSNAFSYFGGYEVKDSLVLGKGYWLKYGSTVIQRMHGQGVNNASIIVEKGWNLIGSITKPVLTSAVTPTIPGNIASSYYGYDAGYIPASTLQPGKGYWIKVNNTDTLKLTTGVFLLGKEESEQYARIEDYNNITVTDKNGAAQTLYFGLDADNVINKNLYEMPPTPPAILFDVRFASQRILETYPKTIEKFMQYSINIQSAEFPLTISWNVLNGNGKNFSLTDAANGKLIGVKELKGEGSFKVTNKDLTSLMLKIENGEELPMDFALGQNYPNPFNPTTKMTIAVPKAALVEMVVYNILGQKVRTLVNEIRPAGYHTIEWNGKNEQGNNVPSGVYFIRMVSGSFNKINKMLMLK